MGRTASQQKRDQREGEEAQLHRFEEAKKEVNSRVEAHKPRPFTAPVSR